MPHHTENKKKQKTKRFFFVMLRENMCFGCKKNMDFIIKYQEHQSYVQTK